MANRRLPSRADFLANHLTPVNPNTLPENQRTCVICQEDYLNPAAGEEPELCVRLPQPCGHTVGRFCIGKWFDTQDANGWFNNRCPYNCDPVYERTDYATELGANELRRRDEAGLPPPQMRHRPNTEGPEVGREEAERIRDGLHRARRLEDFELAERFSHLPGYDRVLRNRDIDRQAQDERFFGYFGRAIGPHHNTRTLDPRSRSPPPGPSRRQRYQARPASPEYTEPPRRPTVLDRTPSLRQNGLTARDVQGNVHGFSRGRSEPHRDSYSGRVVERRDNFTGSGYTLGRMDSDRSRRQYYDSSAFRSAPTSHPRTSPRPDPRTMPREDLRSMMRQVDEELEDVERQLHELWGPTYASRRRRSPSPGFSPRHDDYPHSGSGGRTNGGSGSHHGYYEY
jgi:hypothetical protein